MQIQTSPTDRFLELTAASRDLFAEAEQVLPGGSTRTSIYADPYPLYAVRGDGCWVWDADGTRRLDVIGNYATMILGYGNPQVVSAITEQAARGTAFAANNPLEVRMAKELVDRVPSLDKVRFTSTGTEATMMALRVARAFTGRDKVAKVEGGYHGSHDLVQVSTRPDLATAGPVEAPIAQADALGVPAWVVDNTVVIPFNDGPAATAIIDRHARELAAVIVEPMLGSGGGVKGDPEYLLALRRACDRHGILLIFDEVITFRLSRGGAQARYGIIPDLTALGKLVGGGLPVAAFGGRDDVMALFDQRRETYLPHAGSFNGHPLGMASGLATLAQIDDAVLEGLNRTGDRLRDDLGRLFEEHRRPGTITGDGSIFTIHLTDGPVRNHRDSRRVDGRRRRQFVMGLANHGVLVNQRAMGALSTPIGDREVDLILEAVDRTLAESP